MKLFFGYNLFEFQLKTIFPVTLYVHLLLILEIKFTLVNLIRYTLFTQVILIAEIERQFSLSTNTDKNPMKKLLIIQPFISARFFWLDRKINTTSTRIKTHEKKSTIKIPLRLDGALFAHFFMFFYAHFLLSLAFSLIITHYVALSLPDANCEYSWFYGLWKQ